MTLNRLLDGAYYIIIIILDHLFYLHYYIVQTNSDYDYQYNSACHLLKDHENFCLLDSFSLDRVKEHHWSTKLDEILCFQKGLLLHIYMVHYTDSPVRNQRFGPFSWILCCSSRHIIFLYHVECFNLMWSCWHSVHTEYIPISGSSSDNSQNVELKPSEDNEKLSLNNEFMRQ